MSEDNNHREEFAYRSRSVIPFLICLPVLLFFAIYQGTPSSMRGLSTVVLILGVVFYLLTYRKFKGVFFEDNTIQITNGFRTVQNVRIDTIQKINKEGGSFAVDYRDPKTEKLTRASFVKNHFTEETWQQLSRKLASIRG